MKTSKIFKAGILACSVLALAACTSREKEAEPGHGWGEAVFSLNLVNVGETDVTVQEEATGADGAPFYGFVTSDVTSKTDDVIAREMKSISASWKILRTGKPDPVTVSGLRRAGIPYRYIMFGLTPDGRTYGTPVEVSFETKGEYKAGTMFVSYEGRDEKKNHVFNVSGTNGGYYDIAVLTKENAAKFSSDKELLNALMEQPDKPIKGDGQVLFSNLTLGEYVVYVYGVEEELVEDAYNPTLQYAKSSFSIDRNFDVSYASWLGNWTVPRGNGSDVWVVSAKEEGKTYTITGIESNYDFEVTASYDAATGAMILAEQHEFTTIEVQGASYSVCLFSLFKYTDGKTYVWGTDKYPFLSAEFTTDENSAVFSGLPIEDEKGSYGNAIGYAFFATSGEDIAGGLYGENGPDVLPNNITRGGDVPGTDPEPGYTALLGTWKDDQGNEYTLSEKSVNKSFTLSGFGVDIEVAYNKGTLEFYAQSVGNLTVQGNTLPGVFRGVDSDDYLEDAEQNTTPYLLATGSLSGNKISLKGQEYKAVYSGTTYNEVIVAMGVYVYDENGVIGQAGYYHGVSELINLPGTLSKDGGNPEDPETVSYSSWLGEWEVERQSKTDTWVITENENGKSYYVQGIDGSASAIADIKAVATYDAATGHLVIMTQNKLKTLEINGASYDVNLYGMYNNSKNIVSGDFKVAEAAISGKGKATVTSGGQKVNLNDTEYDVTGMTYFGSPSAGGSSGYVWNSQVFYLWPAAMTQEGGGSEDPGEASEAYKAWLGDWYLVREDSDWDTTNKTWIALGTVVDTWTLSQKVVNKSYTLTGFEGIDDFEITVAFQSNGTATITEQQIANSYTEDGYTITPLLCGNFYYAGDAQNPAGNYLWDNGALICTITPDGKMAPGQAGSYGTFSGMQLYECYEKNGQVEGYGAWHDEGYGLPGSISRTKPNQAPQASSCQKSSYRLVSASLFQSPVDGKQFVSVAAAAPQKGEGKKVSRKREGAPARNNGDMQRSDIQKCKRDIQTGQRNEAITSGTKVGKSN